jgi:hypothetical protein
LLRESTELRASLDYETWVELTRAVVVSARLEDWAQVLELAPATIRHLHWVGNRVLLAAIVGIVARALAPTAAEVAAVLQGAAQRLSAASAVASDPSAPAPTAERPGAPLTSNARFLTELHGATTATLSAGLGEARLEELRAEGEAMDYDHAVARALDAINRARAGTSP